MNSIEQYWRDFSTRFSSFSQREKWLITIVGWLVFGFLLFTVLVEPVLNEHSSKQITLSSLQNKTVELESEVELAQFKLKSDPDKELDQEFSTLIAKSESLTQQLSHIVDGLVTPTRMASLLEEVLVKSHKLKLISLKSLPNESIVLKESSSADGYFIHPVQIEVAGEYFDIFEYLAELEKMSVKYYWRNFHYEVTKYPAAKLVLEVYTLGAKEEFIGG
ncbi:MAG: type II secretion system protein GspM [Vibrio sp.]